MSQYQSSTQDVPDPQGVPRHIAIIMDGNGRWATKRRLPRVAGHAKGVDAVRSTVETCARKGVRFLTLFAFSSENWRRPADEVSVLMRLFIRALQREVSSLHVNGIRLRVVGDLSPFEPKLRELIAQAERRTANNPGMTLTIAANYGGRWDILQAMRAMLREHPELAAQPERIDEAHFSPYLAMAYAPEPDLFIRTGGEQRISNFLLWQLAYTELHFTDTFWPDFDADAIEAALISYRQRERRFGRTSAQLVGQAKA
ncbi:MAG: polyprenyl diphosphate synthase [Burkholderiaceae bacterium]